MKKLLSAILAIALGVVCALGIVACGKGMTDAEIATNAINNLKSLYGSSKREETPRDYEVLGKTKVGDNLYDVVWTVSPEDNGYITVGSMDATSYLVKIEVKRPPEAMDYDLTASVTVGKETKSFTFEKKVPAAPNVDTGNRESTTASITFDDAAKQIEKSEKLVWEENGIKVTATSFNLQYTVNPMRFYAGSKVIIEYPGMKHLEIDSVAFEDGDDYATPIKTGFENAGIPATVTVTDGDLVIDLDYAMDYIEFVAPKQIRMYAIDIIAVVGGANDAEKVAAAKDLTTLSQTIYSATGDYSLPATSYGANLTWSVKGETDLVTVSDNTLTVVKLPTEKTPVTLAFTAKSGSEEEVGEVEISVVPSTGLAHAGTQDDPFTPAEAKALAATVENNQYYTEGGTVVAVFVEGYVVDTGSWASKYNNWQGVYISSNPNGSKDSEDAVQIYGLIIDEIYIKEQSDLVKGSKITVTGALQNYNGTAEVTFYNSLNIKAKAVAYEKAEGTVTPNPDPNPNPGEGTTVSVSIEEYATANNWQGSGAAVYDTIVIDENVSVKVDVGTFNADYGRNSGKYYGNWRIYQNENPSIIFTAASGYTIVSIKVTYSVDKTGVLTDASKSVQYASGEVIMVNANTVTFSVGNTGTVTNGQVRITDIQVVYVEGEGGNLGGEDPIPGGHTHDWNYTHVDGTWTHTATCTGCEEVLEATDCVPALNECPDCKHEYNETEIVNALYALDTGASLKGTYKLTGVVTVVTEQSTQYGNATFTINVSDKDVVVFRAKGEGYDTLKVGDTVTVSGTLVDYNGTKEFTTGGTIISVVAGDSGSTTPDPDEPEVNYGTEEEPLTVAQAIELAKNECATSNAVTAKVVYMKGVITDLGTYNGTYYTNMYFADAGNLGTTILAYTINVSSGVTTPVVGDTVVICGYIKNYNGTIEFASNNGTYVYILSNDEAGNREPAGGEDTPAVSASLVFDANKTARTDYSSTQQVWEANGITFTNLKGSSTTAVGDYSNPVRIYANSTVKIEYTSAMKEIVIHSASGSSYTSDLVTSLTNAGYTATANGNDVTVVLTEATTSIQFTASKQLRFNSIDVKA